MGSRSKLKTKPKAETEEVTAEEAAAKAQAAVQLLQQKQQEQVAACREALPGFLEQYGCRLIPQIVIQGDQFQASVVVTPAPPKQ